MYDIIIALSVFCCVLFFYIHIRFYLNVANDLELYEIETSSKEQMTEIFDFKQPVVFKWDGTEEIIRSANRDALQSQYPSFEAKIRDLSNSEYTLSVYCPLSSIDGVLKHDFISEGNGELLAETGIMKNLMTCDELLRPYFVSQCMYDVLIAAPGTITPLRYDLNYRNFYTVTQGSVVIKLTPPKNNKYLHVIHDYKNLEFRSPVNVWDVQQEYSSDFGKIKFLEITLVPGKMLHIPAYWWWSAKFGENTSMCTFKYKTPINNIATTPQLFMYMLQNQNIHVIVHETINDIGNKLK